MNKKNNIGTSDPIFLPMLQVAFIVLKLCDVIDWNWAWVLAPIWIPPVLVLIAETIVATYECIKERKQK